MLKLTGAADALKVSHKSQATIVLAEPPNALSIREADVYIHIDSLTGMKETLQLTVPQRVETE